MGREVEGAGGEIDRAGNAGARRRDVADSELLDRELTSLRLPDQGDVEELEAAPGQPRQTSLDRGIDGFQRRREPRRQGRGQHLGPVGVEVEPVELDRRTDARS